MPKGGGPQNSQNIEERQGEQQEGHINTKTTQTTHHMKRPGKYRMSTARRLRMQRKNTEMIFLRTLMQKPSRIPANTSKDQQQMEDKQESQLLNFPVKEKQMTMQKKVKPSLRLSSQNQMKMT